MKFGYSISVLLICGVACAQAPKSGCNKSITFAVALNGSLVYRLPNVSKKWFGKAQKKFANVCFPQDGGVPAAGSANYLIVLSTQSSAFNGLYPTYRKSMDTTTSPTSGTGTVTDSNGSAWNYTYQGTITSTTTTTTQTDLPYTDTTVGLYANAYSADGRQVGWARRVESYRQGGDPSNTLGYNLGARLASIHIKEHLLDNIVGRVNALPRADATPHQGIQKDYAQEAARHREVAEQGNADAQNELGSMYLLGQGVPQDYTQAAVWYRKAAEQGNADGEFALGLLYDRGEGVPQDYAEAYFWLDLAAAGKVDEVKPEDVAEKRDDAASHLAPADLSREQERARKWFEDRPAKPQ